MSGAKLGDLYDRMTEEERKKAFFLLFGIAEFYASVDTWFAAVIVLYPPCGRILHDYRRVPDGGKRPGGRARLAISWIVSTWERLDV